MDLRGMAAVWLVLAIFVLGIVPETVTPAGAAEGIPHDPGIGYQRYSARNVPEAVDGFQSPTLNDHLGYEWLEYAYYASCGGSIYHPAEDMNGPGGCDDDLGQEVVAAAAGEVVYVNTGSWGGLVIEHSYQGSTWYTQYGHCQNISVSLGDIVGKGDPVAEIGDVGTDCAHLHFEIREADHPNPAYGPYWDCAVLEVESLVDGYYEPPTEFINDHGPYQGSVTPAPTATPSATATPPAPTVTPTPTFVATTPPATSTPSPTPAIVIHVPGDYATIQEAIDAAYPGCTVLIADGVYSGTGNKDLDYGGKAITVASADGPDNCIIDCEGSGRGFYFHTDEGRDSILDGLTIRNADMEGAGGGIYARFSDPVIRNCRFEYNTAWEGGGAYFYQSEALVWNCLFTDNYVSSNGGAIRCNYAAPVIAKCDFVDNTGSHGAAISLSQSSPDIRECYFSNQGVYGGGIYASETSLALVTDCVFSGNAGGAIHTRFFSDLTVNNCLIINNTASMGGGVHANDISAPIFTNCLIAGNVANSDGGGVYGYNSAPEFYNCTIAGNQAPSSHGGGIKYVYDVYRQPTVRDCIIYDNTGGGISGSVTVSYSCLQSSYPGTGNVIADPLFISGPLGGYYLSQIAAGQAADSPALDAGIAAAGSLGFSMPWGDVYFDTMTTRGDQIADSGQIDIGYHYFTTGFASPTPTATPSGTPSPTPSPTPTPTRTPTPPPTPPPGLYCGPGDSFAQRACHDSEFYGYIESDETVEFFEADDFWGLTNPTSEVSWWGVGWTGDWIECDHAGPFVVSFFQDAGNFPGTLISSQTVSPAIEDTGIDYDGSILYRYHATLPAPVAIEEGWVMIRALEQPGCVFFWAMGCEGNGQLAWGDETQGGWQEVGPYGDMAFCLVTTAQTTATPEPATPTPSPTATSTTVPTATPTPEPPTATPAPPTSTPTFPIPTETPVSTNTPFPGTPTSSPVPGLLGDIDNDGRITTTDALLCFQFALGSETPTPGEAYRADADQDGRINTIDALCIFQEALGIPNGCFSM